MNRKAITVLVAAAAGLIFAIVVWPGRYEVVSAGLDLYRVDRFNGALEKATKDGWRTPAQIKAEAEAAKVKVLAPIKRFGTRENGEFPGVEFECRGRHEGGIATFEVIMKHVSEARRKDMNKHLPFTFRLLLVDKERFLLGSKDFSPTTQDYDYPDGKGSQYMYYEDVPMSETAFNSIENWTLRYVKGK